MGVCSVGVPPPSRTDQQLFRSDFSSDEEIRCHWDGLGHPISGLNCSRNPATCARNRFYSQSNSAAARDSSSLARSTAR